MAELDQLNPLIEPISIKHSDAPQNSGGPCRHTRVCQGLGLLPGILTYMCHEVQVLGKGESSCPPCWAHHVHENLSSLCHFDSRPLLTTEKLFINRICFLSIVILTFHLQFGSLAVPAPALFFLPLRHSSLRRSLLCTLEDESLTAV